MRAQVRGLVKEGRLEFVNAGWSMHDEACPHYEDMINNMMAGNLFLLAEFDYKPRVGWQIDPFGHSAANPRLFAEMGFDAWFFARLDYEDKDLRLKNKEMEFIWRPFWDELGERGQIFTSILFDHYYPPNGFHVDESNQDSPIVDDPSRSNYNLEEKLELFHTAVISQSKSYKTPHILIPYGGDFWYGNAHMTFKNIDKLIKHYNAKYTDSVLFYSNPSTYVDAVQATETTWSVKYDDMLPYRDHPDAVWSGFFTSRATDKEYTRRNSANFRASQQLYSQKIFDTKLSLTEA